MVDSATIFIMLEINDSFLPTSGCWISTIPHNYRSKHALADQHPHCHQSTKKRVTRKKVNDGHKKLHAENKSDKNAQKVTPPHKNSWRSKKIKNKKIGNSFKSCIENVTLPSSPIQPHQCKLPSEDQKASENSLFFGFLSHPSNPRMY